MTSHLFITPYLVAKESYFQIKMAANWNSWIFHVNRSDAVLVAPAEPTQYEFKNLSDIDDQQGLRTYLPIIQFYRHSPSMKDQDPCSVIRHALSKALVPYYPIAGRLRDVQDGSRRLVVECTGEGALFVEADADVCIEQFGNLLCPPFPFLEKLLVGIPRSEDTINLPLLLVQVISEFSI